jgi:hypothetical protein
MPATTAPGRCLETFEPALKRFDSDELARHEGTIFGLDDELRLAYVNPAWDRFARENGGQPEIRRHWDLGTPILHAVPESLRPFYERLLDPTVVHDGKDFPRTRRHEYECSSGSVFRWFHMEVLPLGRGAGLLVINSPIIVRAHGRDREPREPDLELFRDGHGIVRQCSHCRRVSRPRDDARWDWIPAWVEKAPPMTSHTLCPLCLDYHYPDCG